jgi:HK97 gp10 family phage protein
MQSTIKLEGMEEVFKNLRKYGDKVSKANEATAKRGSQVILKEIQNNIGKGKPYPDRITGELENSMKAKIDGVGKTFAVAHIGALNVTKEQAIIANSVEYGHAFPYEGRDSIGKAKRAENKAAGRWVQGKRAEAYPFMRPAIKTARRKVKKIYEEELFKIFNEIKIPKMFD